MRFDDNSVVTYFFGHPVFIGGFIGGGANRRRPLPPLGDELTPALTVMLANDEF